VAFPPNAVFGDKLFFEQLMDTNIDLRRLFGNSNARIITELQHRFDGLPIHSLVYYHSYHQGVLQILIALINMRSGHPPTLNSKLDPTGYQQDCLGMTPLHILACSSAHDLELYCVIVENYPANLITEDRWGALPLLYAFWGAAPTEIIQFLLESYQSLYPGHAFNWTMMVETIGRCDTPNKRIKNLLYVKQMHFPSQPIDWEYLLDKFVTPSQICSSDMSTERMQFLFKCGMSERVEALAFKVWRDCISNMIHSADFVSKDSSTILYEIQDKFAPFEDELPKLKQATTVIELALWKMKIKYHSLEENTTGHKKKFKTDESDIRQQRRVKCGADFIIRHVLLFLVSAKDKE
jgi:hypothetical protein